MLAQSLGGLPREGGPDAPSSAWLLPQAPRAAREAACEPGLRGLRPRPQWSRVGAPSSVKCKEGSVRGVGALVNRPARRLADASTQHAAWEVPPPLLAAHLGHPFFRFGLTRVSR